MAVKTYPHAVIYDGVYYPANAEIKVKEEKKQEEKKQEETPKKRGAK